ncbi:MAG: ABC transporter [Flavobacteriales bacterium]|nr:ABC transporter [Flavobacteriales bacterium]
MKELKYLNKYLYKYRSKLLFGIFITVIARIFSLVAPRLIGKSMNAVEDFLKNKENLDIENLQKTLLIYISIIIGTAFFSGFFTFLMRQAIINVSRFIEFDLKNEIFIQYQKLSQTFYKVNRTGDLMNRISEDVGKVRMYFGPAIMYSINIITLFVVVIAYMVSIAPKLTLYTLIPLPILSFLIYKLNKAIHHRSTIVQEMLSKLSSFTQEMFTGITVIKSYNLAEKIESKFDLISNKSRNKNMNLVKLQAWFFPLMLLLIGASNLIVIYIGGTQYMRNEIKIGVLAEFIIYVNMLTWPVTVVGWLTSIVQQAEASQKRINKFLKEKTEIKDGINNQKIKFESLEFKNVKLKYSDTRIEALKNLSFKVNKGETIGIIGPVGSGKTSIFELIIRLYEPSSGRILINNKSLSSFKLKNIRKIISYVPQNPFLFSDTIADNIKFGKPEAKITEIMEACKSASIYEEIKELNLSFDTILGERGINLSGGQIQRISIARGLLKDPDVILLDDCLSSVDTNTEENILNNLGSKFGKKTKLIVSHRVSSVKTADKILVVKNGLIIEKGNHEDLMKLNKYYKELYNKQIR